MRSVARAIERARETGRTLSRVVSRRVRSALRVGRLCPVAVVVSQFFAPLLAPGHFAGAALAAQAPETAKSPYAEVTLLADRDAVAPGETFTVILRQKLSPGWHTYWANPGATGLATTLNWTAPEGMRIGDIQWPTPQRFNTGGFIDFGFKEEALLLVDVTAPANAPVGGTLDLRVQADWLVCKDLCFPEGQRFSLSLPVDAVSQTDFAASLLAARGRAAQPPDTNAAARYAVSGSALRLEVDAALFAREGVEDIFFFPVDPRAAAPSEPQRVSRTPSGVAVESALNLVGEETPPSGPLTGVLAAWDRSGAEPARLAVTVTAALTELNWTPMASADLAASSGSGGEARASGLDAAPHGATGGASVRDASRDAAGGLGLGLGVGLLPAMLLAALGGVLLNFMPCVFPVLALKALSIANAAQETRAEARAAGLAYGAGVVASFLAFAAALVGLQAAGVAAGWGFQLQNPLVVALLAYLLVLVGLNLGGVFELRWSAAGAGEALTRRGGRAGDFFTGVLAALVASPCTAPFMGAALGYALTQDALTAFAVFAALGVGFAAPIVLLSTSPAMARLAPKPGAWMIRFRQALSFPMFLAAAWLFWVLANQAGVDALFAALAGAVALSFAAWALGVGFPDGRFGRWAAGGAAAVAILCAALALTPLQGGVEAGASNADARQASEDARSAAIGDPTPFAAARLAAFRAEGRTVFLNVTADWCVSCKVNELNVLNGERFETLLAQADAAYMLGDWTLRDEAITDLLRGFGRIGVPLYVVYPGDGGAPRVLPQILTLGIVSDGLGLEAEPRRADGAVGGAAASPG